MWENSANRTKITGAGHIFPRNKNTGITQALSSWWQPGYYRAWNVSMMSHCAVQIAAKSGCLRGDVPPRKRISFKLDAKTRDTKFRVAALFRHDTSNLDLSPHFYPCLVFQTEATNLFIIPFFLPFFLFFFFLFFARGEDISYRDTYVNRARGAGRSGKNNHAIHFRSFIVSPLSMKDGTHEKSICRWTSRRRS